MQLQARRRSSCRQVSPRPLLDSLESRVLMHAGLDGQLIGTPAVLGSLSNPMGGITVNGGALAANTTFNPTASVAVSSMTTFHSNPSATAKLFLDFNGSNAMTWGAYNAPAQTAYSTDTDTSTFSVTEQQQIYEIWQRVAEKYSPFNIDVTTQDPGNRNPYSTLAVVMASDDGSWLGGQYGGIAYVGSFDGGTGGNTVFVFPKNLGPYAPQYIGEAASHESGHGFGLSHQSTYSGTTKTNEYNPGDSSRAPVMGDSYNAQRGLWWYGTSTSSTTYQDDMATISSSANRFGYRADDHTGTVNSGDPLTISGTSVSGNGIIEKTSDSDAFSFTTGAGSVTLTVNPAAYGPTLDLKLDLYNASGALVTSINNNVFTESLSTTLAAGNYTLVVSSAGNYGDVGQYTISGNIVAPTTPSMATPTNLVAAANGSQVNVSWSDTNTAETGVVVQRSVNGGSFADYASLGAFSTNYADSGISAGNTYAYRVYAVNGSTTSSNSNSASVTLAPAAPASLTASAASSSAINLTWADTTGETGFRVERSTDGVNFTTIANLAQNTLSYADSGLTASTTYTYRVFASNAGGTSAASPIASATTQAASVVTLNAPTGLTATTQKNQRIRLQWSDTNTTETGYVVEQSTNGTTFSVVATLAANTTSYQTGRLNTGTTYWFRVKAINGATSSAYSNIAQLTARGAAGGLAVGGPIAPVAAPTPATRSNPFRFFGGLARLPVFRH